MMVESNKLPPGAYQDVPSEPFLRKLGCLLLDLLPLSPELLATINHRKGALGPNYEGGGQLQGGGGE